MATPKKQATIKNNTIPGKCKDCVHSYDYHNRSVATGDFILCKCKFPDGAGKYWSHFLSRPCEIKIKGKYQFKTKIKII